MTFRYKPDRLKYRTAISTLDETHHKYMTIFDTNKKSLPGKQRKLQTFKIQLDKLNKKNGYDLTDEDIEKKTNLRYEITKLTDEIYDISNFSSELDYYSKTTQILLEYYETIDNTANTDDLDDNDNVSVCSSNSDKKENINISSKLIELNEQSQHKRKFKKLTKKRPKHGEQQNSKCILDFFDSKIQEKSHSDTESKYTQKQDKSKKIEEHIVEHLVSNRATLFDEYMSIVDKSYNCGRKKSGIIRWCSCSKEMTLIQAEGMFVCQSCGLVEYVIIESEIPNYKESGNEKPAYPYKRVNHLIECLNQFQAKESTEIPPDIYNQILTEIRKNKMSVTSIAFDKMKNILKKLRLNQYYEHIPHIISKITGKPAPTLNLDTEDEIKNMFKKIQEPFAKHCPKDRTNFLSYSYVLHKFFQLLKLSDFLSYFPLLKSREKLRVQDKIWKNICIDLGWNFYPSI